MPVKQHYVVKGLISLTGTCTLVSGLKVQYLCLLTSFYPLFKLKNIISKLVKTLLTGKNR